jgi:hypothetical protein
VAEIPELGVEWPPCATCGRKADALCEGCSRTVCKLKRCTKAHEACATPDDLVELEEMLAR